jgi:hypothetical protein
MFLLSILGNKRTSKMILSAFSNKSNNSEKVPRQVRLFLNIHLFLEVVSTKKITSIN